jgi:hypothetical protein
MAIAGGAAPSIRLEMDADGNLVEGAIMNRPRDILFTVEETVEMLKRGHAAHMPIYADNLARVREVFGAS